MLISYNVRISIINLIDDSTISFTKGFSFDLNLSDTLLYDNYHILDNGTYILNLFKQEIDDYCLLQGLDVSSVEIDEYELQSVTNGVDVFFINLEDESKFTLSPSVKCYVYPKEEPVKIPTLIGQAYDSTTIVWSWPEDGEFAHYLIDEPTDVSDSTSSHIIAQLPAGRSNYIETNLEPNTAYSRRLINYTETQTSTPSAEVTVKTECVVPTQSLDQYFIEREEDFTTKDEDRLIIEDRLTAFHSGVGNGLDLKVYKQLDSDFYEKFKPYIELTGAYFKREKRYDQVGFNYKLCLEALETVEEQEGEVTFKVDCYPKQTVTISQYLYGISPLTVFAKAEAYVLLKKAGAQTSSNSFNIKNMDTVVTTETIQVEKFTANATHFVFTVDVSGSMKTNKIGSETWLKLTQDAMKKAVATIAKKKDDIERQIEKSDKFGTNELYKSNVYLSIVLFAANASIYKKQIEISTKKLPSINYYIDHMMDSDYTFTNITNVNATDGNKVNTNWTNWTAGVRKTTELVRDYLKKDPVNAGLTDSDYINIFFSDGEPNLYIDNGVNKLGVGSDASVKARNDATKYYAGYLHNQFGTVYMATKLNNYLEGVRTDINAIKTLHRVDGAANPVIEVSNTATSMSTMFDGIIESCKTIVNVDVYKEEDVVGTEKVTIDMPINKVDMKYVKIATDPIGFTFKGDGSDLSIYYDTNELRAKVMGKMPARKLSESSIQSLLMAKVNSLPEIAQGYETVKTDTGIPIFSNLVVYDNFAYGDEDTWAAAPDYYDFALRGSINVYPNKVGNTGTVDYSDDYYVISNDSYLYIEGATEALIYEASRFATVTINAKNNPQATVFRGGMDARMSLTNRKNKEIVFPGDMNTVIAISEVVEQDEYVFITGNGLSTDMVATTYAHFFSPVLNYKFNLEDPDAYTPYYEILPMCNPKSIDRNIIDLTIYKSQNVFINNEYINGFNTINDKEEYDSSLGAPIVKNYDNEFIDRYIHFMAKPMRKTRPYYDELPGKGSDVFYGLVNGRYQENNKPGKQNLTVETPKFNIPTTVLDSHADSVRIYARVTEFYPESALVSYSWLHEKENGSTTTNGDTLTFSCDSLTYKDVEYRNIIGTYEKDEIELENVTIKEMIYNIDKPLDVTNKYSKFYLKIMTDNSDILATKFPTEVIFDGNTAAIPVTFKGIVNATSMWNPRIHNGFYYLNQHEHFLYSEFNVKGNFDKQTEVVYKDMDLFISFQVSMSRNENINEIYSILKNTINELLQNEEDFVWENGKGLTLKPILEGLRYKHYQTKEYISPVIMFPYQLTTVTQSLSTEVENNNGLPLNIQARYYNLEEGKWSEWEALWGGANTTPLSAGYQLKIQLSATETHKEYEEEDYMCSYLDWKDEMTESACSNITTAPDYITTQTEDLDGIFVSRIFDYGCPTGLLLNVFGSSPYIKGYVAFGNSEKDLVVEAAHWVDMIDAKLDLKYRYYRYKLVIPKGDKVYWVYKKYRSLESEITLPYIKSISMGGNYVSADITDSFLNTENFKIPRDGKEYKVIDKIKDYIETDVINFGFTLSDITKIDISSNLVGASLTYDLGLNAINPNVELLETGIIAKATEETIDVTTYYPYIFVEDTNKVVITGTPQQYCPISVEDENGNTYLQLFDDEMSEDNLIHTDSFEVTEKKRFFELKYNNYDKSSLVVLVNGIEVTDYTTINNLIVFKNFLLEKDKVSVSYSVMYSFYANINRKENTTTIALYTGKLLPMPVKVKVKFETSLKNNKLRQDHLSLNPIYRSDYKGFIYLTDDINVPEKINIYCNPKRIKAGGIDKVDVIIELLDELGNPVVDRRIGIDIQATLNGSSVAAGSIENAKDFITDINGIVHVVYKSSLASCITKLKATHIREDFAQLQNEIEIVNY